MWDYINEDGKEMLDSIHGLSYYMGQCAGENCQL